MFCVAMVMPITEDVTVEPVLNKEQPVKGKWDDEDMDDDDVKDSWEDEDAPAPVNIFSTSFFIHWCLVFRGSC